MSGIEILSEELELCRVALARAEAERDVLRVALVAVPEKEIRIMDEWVGSDIHYMPVAWGKVRWWLERNDILRQLQQLKPKAVQP